MKEVKEKVEELNEEILELGETEAISFSAYKRLRGLLEEAKTVVNTVEGE